MNPNILQPKNTNLSEPDSNLMSCSKRNSPDSHNTDSGSSKKKKRWSLSAKKEKSDELADLGLGVLEADEVLNVNSESSEINRDMLEEWDEYGSSLLGPILESNTKYVEVTPVTFENKENKRIEPKETPRQQQQRHLADDFGIIRRRDLPTNSDAPDVINNLSDEVILHILKWLPKSSLMHCASVSKRFCRLSRDESLWNRLDLSCRSLYVGALGEILDRGVQVFRLAQTEIADPAILPTAKSFDPQFQSKLQYLDLSMATISVQTASMLFQRCRFLKKLSLENVNINEECCKYLGHNSSLEVLNMTMVSGLNVNCMKYLLTSLSNLKELNLAWTHLSNHALSYVCLNLPFSLSRLNLSGCRKTLLDNNIRQLVNSCPNLRELDISDCTSLTAETVETILELQNLKFLAMSRCYAIPPAAFKKLKLLSSLVSFDIHGHMPDPILNHLKDYFGEQPWVNKFFFSSVARPTVGMKRTSIWNIRVKD